MSKDNDIPNIDDLSLSDSDPAALFDSPPRQKKKVTSSKDPNGTSTDAPTSKQRLAESRYTTEEAHEAALRAELESVRKINEVIEGVVSSLEKAKSNMATISRTTTTATTLLQTWTRILSQTEHNQRLLLNPSWQGASHDLAELESEALHRQQAAERREAEEMARREAATRRAEEAEEERRRQEAVEGRSGSRTGSRTGRGRGRARVGSTASAGTGRGGGAVGGVGSGYVGVGGQGGRGAARRSGTAGRGASGIGRGVRGSGRGRGLG